MGLFADGFVQVPDRGWEPGWRRVPLLCIFEGPGRKRVEIVLFLLHVCVFQ